MKSQRGITLTSLVIYIVLVFIVLGIVITVTENFQSNINQTGREGTEIVEINNFNMYFLQEVKKSGNKIVEIDENKIIFSLGNKYIFDENSANIKLIELDKEGAENKEIILAEDIEKCSFSKKNEEGKTIVVVNIKTKNTKETTKEYVLIEDENILLYEDEKEYI